MMKLLSTTALALVILVPAASAQEFVFRYKVGVLGGERGIEGPPTEGPEEPGEGNPDPDDDGEEEAEIEAPEEMPDLEMTLTDFMFSHDRLGVPTGHAATGGYILAAMEVENTGNVGLDFANIPAELGIGFSIGFGAWWIDNISCSEMGILMPGQAGTCHVRSQPLAASTICPQFNSWPDDTMELYGRPGASLTWNGQWRNSSGSRVDQDMWTMNRIGCDEPEPDSDPRYIVSHGAAVTASGILRPGDVFYYNVIVSDRELEPDPDGPLSWPDVSSMSVRLNPVPGGDFLQAKGISEQPVCREFEGWPFETASGIWCDPVTSSPITLEEICTHPGSRISGTFQPGIIEFGTTSKTWGFMHTANSYDLELDKSGCAGEG